MKLKGIRLKRLRDFGDANLNQTIDLIDFGFLAGGFGEEGGWVDGTSDGFLGVNILDLGLMADNFGKDLTTGQTRREWSFFSWV